MPQVGTNWNYQGHHTHIGGLSVEDRNEKCLVLTHWLSGMLQPQHPTGPYLSGADCAAWYASVLFVRKKRHCSESMMSQKQARDINPLPHNFCVWTIKSSCLLTPSLWRSVHCSFFCTRMLWCILHLGPWVCNVLYKNMKSRLSSFYQDGRLSRPLVVPAGLAAVASWGSDAMGLTLSETDKIRAGTKTAVQHVCHRAAQSTEGYSDSQWKGSVTSNFSMGLNHY